MVRILALSLVLGISPVLMNAQNPLPLHFESSLKETMPYLDSVYKQLHQNPETAGNEVWTSQTLSVAMQRLGFEVFDHIGGYGLVCVLKNGPGDTVMYRVEMDGLEIKENTGLPYASQKYHSKNSGDTIWYMHACSHDMHMAVWLGAAQMMTQHRDAWNGTLICIAQPAEEDGSGAKNMLESGLYERFGKPKCVIAIHDDANLVAGAVAVVAGPAMAQTTSVDITLKGKSAHGGYPHLGIDVIVMAARCILAFQTIISRELEPATPAVITIGKIAAGTRRNQIPDELHMELTLRTYSQEVSSFLVRRIKEICHGIALSAGVNPSLMPIVEIVGNETPALVNDSSLVQQALKVFQATIGTQHVMIKKPVMGGEDFSRYGLTKPRVPILLFWLGTVAPEVYKDAQLGKIELPSLHSSKFAPDVEQTLQTGVKSVSALLMKLLN